ncbi:TetR family transcriptional regulator [Frigoribacterium sp. PhB107]|uniref:TetR/AcrR family transcriptional regulator n=1 Tax=Frigoribacterium sp. PhB107 TaxID=2485172 RepID=UPI000F49F689|nr:TetR/AcrR family transcriptional regulator [Frigoribacterium sp. PhB107]ROP78741.1 TetR family transcriptional regulator [Frigoribacterium sp. PhB107]
MPSTAPALDRRAALKARHRQAILDAADALIAEQGAPRFSVDELAARADVSRRTIFNHFASLDEVVMTLCTAALTDAIDEFRAATTAVATSEVAGTRSSLFDEVVLALRSIDLPAVVAYLWRVLDGDAEANGANKGVQDVFSRATEHLAADAARRSIAVDQLDVELLVSSLLHGIAVIAEHWVRRTDGALDDEGRAVWAELLDRLVTSVRTGYAPPA